VEAKGLAEDKKNATRLGAHLVFIDESGFLLIPSVRRTWAPRGQTPLLRFWQRHDRVSVISGISVSPQRRRFGLYFRPHLNNIRQPQICAFLRHLLRHLRGPVIVVWDRGNIHKGQPLRDLCRRFPRLRIEYLPAYAPELNPDEAVWTLAKGKLANGRPDSVEDLKAHLRSSLVRIRRSQTLLRSCITQSDLPPFLS
jgi:transposase